MNFWRKRIKEGPASPLEETSWNTDANEKAIEQETFYCKYEIKLAHYIKVEDKLEENWVRVYSLIYDNYYSREMQIALKEHAEFSTKIKENPLELLIEVKKLTHVSKKAAYPILMLVEAPAGMHSLHQGDKEGLVFYLERFKLERNVLKNVFGND